MFGGKLRLVPYHPLLQWPTASRNQLHRSRVASFETAHLTNSSVATLNAASQSLPTFAPSSRHRIYHSGTYPSALLPIGPRVGLQRRLVWLQYTYQLGSTRNSAAISILVVHCLDSTDVYYQQRASSILAVLHAVVQLSRKGIVRAVLGTWFGGASCRVCDIPYDFERSGRRELRGWIRCRMGSGLCNHDGLCYMGSRFVC